RGPPEVLRRGAPRVLIRPACGSISTCTRRAGRLQGWYTTRGPADKGGVKASGGAFAPPGGRPGAVAGGGREGARGQRAGAAAGRLAVRGRAGSRPRLGPCQAPRLAVTIPRSVRAPPDLARVKEAAVVELWMVEALPAYSAEFWRS